MYINWMAKSKLFYWFQNSTKEYTIDIYNNIWFDQSDQEAF